MISRIYKGLLLKHGQKKAVGGDIILGSGRCKAPAKLSKKAKAARKQRRKEFKAQAKRLLEATKR